MKQTWAIRRDDMLLVRNYKGKQRHTHRWLLERMSPSMYFQYTLGLGPPAATHLTLKGSARIAITVGDLFRMKGGPEGPITNQEQNPVQVLAEMAMKWICTVSYQSPSNWHQPHPEWIRCALCKNIAQNRHLLLRLKWEIRSNVLPHLQWYSVFCNIFLDSGEKERTWILPSQRKWISGEDNLLKGNRQRKWIHNIKSAGSIVLLIFR